MATPHESAAEFDHGDGPVRAKFDEAFDGYLEHPKVFKPGFTVHDMDGGKGRHTRSVHVISGDYRHWVLIKANSHPILDDMRDTRLPDLGIPGIPLLAPGDTAAEKAFNKNGRSINISIVKASTTEIVERVRGGGVRRILGSLGLGGLSSKEGGDEPKSRVMMQLSVGSKNAAGVRLAWLMDKDGWKLHGDLHRGEQYDKDAQRLLLGTGLDLLMPVDELAGMQQGRPHSAVVQDPNVLQPLVGLPDMFHHYVQR